MKLRRQEKIVSFAAIIIVVIFILLFKLILPSRQKSGQLEKKIGQKKQELKEIQTLQTKYENLLKLEEEVRASLDKREKNFFSPALWARLAEKAKIPKEKFKQEIKQPSNTGEKAEYKEVSAHLELDGVTLEQSAKFIYEIESADHFFKIKNLNLRRAEKTPGLLKVTFDVVTQIK